MRDDSLADDTFLAIYPDHSKLYEFIGDSFRRVSAGYLVGLLVFLGISFGVYFTTRAAAYGAIWPNQIVYYLVIGFHILYRLKHGRANILSLDMLFLFFYTMFHLGYVTLFSLNIVPQSDYIFHYEQSIPRAMFVVNLGLLGFLFGYEAMGIRAPVVTDWPLIIRPRHVWETVAVFLMVLSIVMHFLGLTLVGWDTVMREGYWAIQAADHFTTNHFTLMLLSFCNPLMSVAITIHVVACALRYGKMFHSKVALIFTIFYFAVVILEGERGAVVMFATSLLLVRHFFVKWVKTRYLFLLFVGGLILFAGLAVVRKTVFQPGKMFQEYQYQKQSGRIGWESLFIEAGGSFMPLNITTQDVPTSEPYWLGASWLDAAVHVVPFLQGFWVKSGYAKLAPSQWATFTYFGYEAAGVGFTVAAEGYLNFGFPGAFIELMLVGMFLRWLMIFFGRRPSAVRAIIMLGCLGSIIVTVRAEFNSLFSPCARIVVLAWLLNLFLGNETQVEEFAVSEQAEHV